MKRPQNFDELLDIAKKRPDVHGALSQLGISLKRVGHSMGGVRWQTETKSGTSGDLSAIAFIEKSDGSWIIFDNKGRIGQQSMDAITCLREIFHVSFDDAVYMLSGGAPSAPVAKPKKLTLERKAEPIEEHTYTPPTPTPDKLRHVKAYLIQTRKLPKELVLTLIDSGKISATERFKSKTAFCTFPITDENGNNVGTDMAATIDDLPKEYKKHLEKGSNADYAWCFPYEVEDITSETPIFFCEAPIDTMSLCALSGTPGIYVSMAGCKDRTFTSVTEKLGGTPIICVDNDETGDAFATRHPDVTRMVAPIGKDWNDTLKYYIENNMSYAFAPPDAEAAPDVPLEDNVAHVHYEREDVDPKKENGALDKGASENDLEYHITNFQRRLDAWDKKTEGFSFVITNSPKYLLEISTGKSDSKEKQIRIDASKIKKILKDHPDMSIDTIKNIPYLINDPILVLDSKTVSERLVLLGELYINNRPVTTILELNPRTRSGNNTYTDIIKVASAYPRSNLQNLLNNSNIRFIATNKSRVEDWLKVNRLQLPLPNSQSDSAYRVSQLIDENFPNATSETGSATPSINIIPPTDEKINTSDEKNSTSLYDKDPPIADNVGKHSQDELRATPDAEVAPDVPLEDNVGGHVVHLDNEVIDPKKENGALGKGASVDEEIQADKGLLKFINDIEQMQDKSLLSKRSYNIGLISENHRILLECLFKNEFNIEHNFSGYSMQINGSAVSHIQKRHGKNGNADQTMANDEDIAKLGIIANSADEFEVLRKADGSIDTSAEFRNKKGERSPKIALKKSINNNTFVVIECVPESNKKTIHIVSARKEKGGIGQVLNIEANASPQLTSKTPVDYPATTNIIPENTEKVNTLDEKNSKPLNDEDPPIADNNGKQSQDELRATLEAKVADVVNNYRADPRALAEYVIFSSRFNNYSANNLRLIWSQYPYAQYVTSAYDFSHGLPDKDGKPTISEKIFIKKGEHALRIWKPYDVKYTVMPDGTEKRSAWLTKSEREQATAEKWKELTRKYFTLVPVFDITQTTASPDVYPKLCGLGGIKGTSADARFNALKNYCENVLNCPIIIRDFGERKATVRGSFYPNLNEIHISDMLEGENKLSTFIHELGHATLHADSYKNASKSTAQIELEADMYALMIERRLGIEPTDARCRHLKAHYDEYIAEIKSNDINADTELFNNVIDRYREQIPLIDAYVDNLNIKETQTNTLNNVQDLPQEQQRTTPQKL